LVKRGEKVIVLDNLSTGDMQNISDIFDAIEFVAIDVRDLESVRKVVEGVDFVLHQAALPSVARSVDNPIDSNEVNVNGTLNLLVAARDAGVKRFVYAASSSAYGNSPALPKNEDMPSHPLSPYAVSKLLGEHYCRIFHTIYKLETVSLRYFNVFGPRQDPASPYSAAIPRFINAILKGDPVTIYGDGEQSRDFTYIQNVVNANLLACEAPDAAGTVINVACGDQISLNLLISIMEKQLGIEAQRVYTQPLPGDVKHSRADISRAREILGYEPAVAFDKGLKMTVQWFTNGHRALTEEKPRRH
jgi:nucleoside-diphosphate-sugar epimerase